MSLEFRKLRPEESELYRSIRLECLQQYPEYFCSDYRDEVKKEKLFFQEQLEQGSKDNFVMGAFDKSPDRYFRIQQVQYRKNPTPGPDHTGVCKTRIPGQEHRL